MTVDITEKDIHFEFGASWTALKYDEHPHYRNQLNKMSGVKAVDIVGAFREERLYFLEVKDFRRASLSETDRQRLAEKIAHKVKDTFAGMVGAYNMSGDFEVWDRLCPVLLNRENRPMVVFLLVERPAVSDASRHHRKAQRSILKKSLQQACRWLTTDTLLLDLGEWAFPDARVTGLAPRSSN
jgi:hypothetical protein